MNKNHLIIGLGGTGGKVIRNLRKTIYRDCRDTSPQGAKLDYLYIDSSSEMMGVDDPDWKVLGENLQLNLSSQMELKGSDLAERLKNINAYPEIAPWIGEPQDWNAILNLGSGAKVLGGQKRRLGRFLFATQAADFKARLRQKISDLTSNANASATIHVVCGLAGGTGSGILIDVISQIRSEYQDSKSYPIILYLLLPDAHPKQGWNTGNYHANGYAALMELNALSVGNYMPYDLAGDGNRVVRRKETPDEKDKPLKDPFKICYLVSDHNSNGLKFDVDKEVPDQMAELIYQKLIAEAHEVAKVIGRIEEWENMEVSHEGSVKGDFVTPERSRLFASFGIKKISYPEEEIRDYIGYSLSRQTLRQMLYNNWAQGFLNEPAATSVEGFVGSAENQEKFNVDKATFFLEKRFAVSETENDQAGWKPIEDEWKNFIGNVATDVIGADGNWLSEIRRLCEERYSSRYRNDKGVVEYFNWKKDRIGEYARDLCSKIEESLCFDLIEGRRSMLEIEAVLFSLCELLKRQDVDWQRQAETNAKQAAKEKIRWMENMQRFEDLGPLARMFPGSKEKIFEAGKVAMINYFGLSTKVVAWEFAQLLERALQNELLKVCDQVKKSITAMKEAVLHCESSVEAHTPDEKSSETEKVCLRLYNGDEVTRYIDALISNKEFQELQSRRARNQLLEHLMMGQLSLKALPSSKEAGNIQDILARASHSTLKDFDAGATQSDSESGTFRRLLSVSIIDKLEERYSGDADRMRKELVEFLRKAGTLLPLNQAEHSKSGPGTEYSKQNLKGNLVIMMPDADAEEGFAHELREALRLSVPDGSSVDFIDTGKTRRHEITILRFVQLFPVRYVEVLSKLKEEYQIRLRDGDERRRKLELHTEGSASDYPALFVPAVDEQVGPAVLLGMQLGVIRQKSSGEGIASWDGPLVMVNASDIPQKDLGNGFDGAVMGCSNRNDLGTLQKFNTAAIKATSSEKLNSLVVELSALAKTLSGGNDDRLRKLSRFAEMAEIEFKLVAKELASKA